VAAADRVAVADNLFAAGETVLAADIYRQVAVQEISRDEAAWVQFQLANCERRLGRLDEARKRYRRLVADPTIEWQDIAKWWLNALDEQDALAREHLRLSTLIRQLETANAPVKP
jgi:hypothetical protein